MASDTTRRFLRSRAVCHPGLYSRCPTTPTPAARSFRDSLIKKLGPADTGPHRDPSSRNTSGIVGVRRREATRETDEYTYYHYFWEASWTDASGERQKRNFSVNKYGEDKAKSLAIAARKKGLAAARRGKR